MGTSGHFQVIPPGIWAWGTRWEGGIPWGRKHRDTSGEGDTPTRFPHLPLCPSTGDSQDSRPRSIPHLLPLHGECDGCCSDAASQMLQGESQGPARPQISQILVYPCHNSREIQALLPASAPGNSCSPQSWKCHVQVSQPSPSWCHRDGKQHRPPCVLLLGFWECRVPWCPPVHLGWGLTWFLSLQSSSLLQGPSVTAPSLVEPRGGSDCAHVPPWGSSVLPNTHMLGTHLFLLQSVANLMERRQHEMRENK